MKGFAIIGAGVLGRTIALELLDRSHKVEIWDPFAKCGEGSTAYVAGGMLAPFSEREKGEPTNFQLGVDSLELWPALAAKLDLASSFNMNGSLIVAHSRDHNLWLDVAEKVCDKISAELSEKVSVREYEPQLAAKFHRGLFLPTEGHVDPRAFLQASYYRLLDLGARWHESKIELNDPVLKDFDHIIDCRGMGAYHDNEKLRGVRGEAIIVRAPEVEITRPIRIMHPRYSLYVVPRSQDQYYLGATQIENSSSAGITVRSALELLSAAFSVHSGFAEAEILETCTGLRPALFNNEPQIHIKGRHIAINGLYRHGFLMSPIISKFTCQYLFNEAIPELAHKIIKEDA